MTPGCPIFRRRRLGWLLLLSFALVWLGPALQGRVHLAVRDFAALGSAHFHPPASIGVTSGQASSVTVNGSAASLYADRTFARAGLTLTNGTNTFIAVGSDSLGRTDTHTLALHLPASLTFTSDANGDLLSDGRWYYRYSPEGRLHRIERPSSNPSPTDNYSEFIHDAFGRTVCRRDKLWNGGGWTVTNEIRYVHAGRLVLQERDSSNIPRVTYTRGLDLGGSIDGAGGIGGLLARTDHTSGAVAYYHADGNGNVSMLFNAWQQPVARYLYDPFGNTLAATGPLAEANTYRFSSKEIHPTTGLYAFGERWYHPNLNRWLSKDPSGMVDGPNLYAFCRNGPTYGGDPWGREFLLWGDPDWETINRQYGWAADPLMYSRYGHLIPKVLSPDYEDSDVPARNNATIDSNFLDPTTGQQIMVADLPAKFAETGVKVAGNMILVASAPRDAALIVDAAAAAVSKLVAKRIESNLALAAKRGQMLFRGVPGNGTQKAILGQQGVAIPRGTALDEGSLIKHVLGEDVSAGVTSWTTERAVAVRFSGPGGTVIEVPLSKVSSQIVPRPPVPKHGGESEVLLRGTVQGTPTRP